MQEALFCQALGLAAPWAVERVELDVERSRIDLYVVWQATSAACPACSAADQKLHDHRQRKKKVPRRGHIPAPALKQGKKITIKTVASSAYQTSARAKNNQLPTPAQAQQTCEI